MTLRDDSARERSDMRMISRRIQFLTANLTAAIMLAVGCTKPGVAVAIYIKTNTDATARTVSYQSGKYARYATKDSGGDGLADRRFETGTYRTNN